MKCCIQGVIFEIQVFVTDIWGRWLQKQVSPQPWISNCIKWKHFLWYWPFVRGIHRSPGNSPRKGQWRGALIFSLICAWIYGWVKNREAGDLRRHRAHYTVIVISMIWHPHNFSRSFFYSWLGEDGLVWMMVNISLSYDCIWYSGRRTSKVN